METVAEMKQRMVVFLWEVPLWFDIAHFAEMKQGVVLFVYVVLVSYVPVWEAVAEVKSQHYFEMPVSYVPLWEAVAEMKSLHLIEGGMFNMYNKL